MSIKIAMMAFQALEEADIRSDVTRDHLIEADRTGRLQFYAEDQLKQSIEVAALKRSWSLDRRTGKYVKF